VPVHPSPIDTSGLTSPGYIPCPTADALRIMGPEGLPVPGKTAQD
jgi:hypothetical protein